MKRIWRVLIITIVIFVIAGFAARKYLTSRRVAAQVAARLEAVYGGLVVLNEADIGLRGSSFNGMQLFEKGTGASQEPWLTVDAVATDLSLLNLLGGNASPKKVTLSGAAVTLRFDRAGRLLTRLPDQPAAESAGAAALPNLSVEHSRIILQKQGAADLIFSDISATLRDDGDRMSLTGQVDNAAKSRWGKWTLRGDFNRQTHEASIALRSNGALHVTPTMLNEMHFVPPSVTTAVQVEGDTPVSVVIRYDLARQGIHYRIEMEPRATHLHVPSIDLEATDATGTVVVDDGLVQLRDVRGQAFEGTIRASADLDFRQAATRLDFSRIEVHGLNMRRLPASWDLPRQIEGRLNGSAKLEVVLGGGKPQTRGEGQGQIDDARIGGQATSAPVRLELHAREGGFGFRQPTEPIKKDPPPQEEDALDPFVILELSLLEQDAAPADVPLAARIINDFSAGLDLALQGLVWAGSEVARVWTDKLTIAQWKPAGPGRYVEVNLSMQRVDLALLVKGLGLKLPFAVGGRLSYQVQASIPLDTPADFKTYRVKGSAQVTQLRVADIDVEELRASVDYANGVLSLKDVSGRIADGVNGKPATAGAFRGAVRFQLVPLGELTADITLEQIPLSRAAALAGAAARVGGSFSGTLAARVPAARLQDVAAWDAVARITAAQLEVFGWTVQDAAADVRLKQGTLSSENLQAQVEAAALTGSAQVRLSNPYRYEGEVALHGWDLSALQRLVPGLPPAAKIEGRFSTTASVLGTLQPLSVATTGKGAATDLKVYGVKVNDAALAWKSDLDRITIDELRARLYDGAVAGNVAIPLRPAASGGVNLRITDLDVGALGTAFPAMPFAFQGKAGGTLKATLAPAAPGKERALALDLDLQAPRLRLQGVPTEQLKGTIGYHEGAVAYGFQGKTLGGSFELNGDMPALDAAPGKPSNQGRLRVRAARLSGVSEIFRMRPDVLPLRGLVDLDIIFRHEGPDRAPVGSGRVVVSRPRWGVREIAELVQGEVLLTRQELRLRDISASVGEGLIRSQLAFNLHRLEQSWFTLSLERVEAARLVEYWPTLAGKFEGLLEAHLRGRLGPEWSGSGDFFLGRGKVLGAEVTDWRLPLTWSFAPGEDRGEIACRETSARMAGGQVSGHATLRWGTGLCLEGQLLFFHVGLHTLLHQTADAAHLPSGRISGRFSFGGAELRSVDDLAGGLDATLTQTQAFQFPVLKQIAPYLRLQPSSTFESGEVHARLARGVFRVQNLSLQRPPLTVAVEGNVALAGRLDLEVTAKTGVNDLASAPLPLLRLPLQGAIPVLRLRVTGTTRNPNIRVESLLSGR